MASLSMAFAAPAAVSGRVFHATAVTKSTGGGAEEKGVLDWILGGLAKEDQLVETDPILKKTEEKNGSGGTGTAGGTGTTRRKSTTSVSAPSSKKSNGGSLGGVFGGLFTKK